MMKLPPPDGGGREPQCGYCAARFHSIAELGMHVYQSHGGPKPPPPQVFRRDFNEFELSLIRQGRKPEAKQAWHARTGK